MSQIVIDYLDAVIDGEVSVPIAAWDVSRNRLVGSARVVLHQPEVAVLRGVFVMEEYRRIGLGANMVRIAMRWAENRQLPLYLAVHPRSTDATRLYERLGFEPCPAPYDLPPPYTWMRHQPEPA